jgi:RNA polymerase sigma factor (TIGR02999 family)
MRRQQLAVQPNSSASALLAAWGQGDQGAFDKLFPLVDAELRQLARRHMAREVAGHTLQATALINEAYLRLVGGPRVQWQNRAHFFAMAARLMRHILIDHARAKRNVKRGGDLRRVPLSDARLAAAGQGEDVIALDEALDALAALDPRRGRVVELRVFGGLSVAETAGVLKVSADTVMRDWKLAKAWLGRELRKAPAR